MGRKYGVRGSTIRDFVVKLRFSAAERDVLNAAALREGTPLAVWIRGVGLRAAASAAATAVEPVPAGKVWRVYGPHARAWREGEGGARPRRGRGR